MAGLWNMGFRKQILLNGHGQEYVIPTAIHQFAKIFQVPGVFINVNWYHAVPDHFKTKDQAAFTTRHSSTRTKWKPAGRWRVFPELMDMSKAVDTTPRGYLPEGHVDKAGNLLHRPICWYGQVGCGPIEIAAYPEGVVGKATAADAEKAKPGIEAFMDHMVKLHDHVLAKFPAGELPPIDEITGRKKEDIEAVVKGPLKGGRSIYTLAYPT